MKLGIFCKQIHVEKIVNFLNTTNIDYVIYSKGKTNEHFAYYSDFDIGISYCAGFIIDFDKEKKIQGQNRPWYNYHPHPLPQYKGYSSYAKAIDDSVRQYGVTLHKMVQRVDDGEIIQEKNFELESVPCHPNELGNICHYYLFQLFKETIVDISVGVIDG